MNRTMVSPRVFPITATTCACFAGLLACAAPPRTDGSNAPRQDVQAFEFRDQEDRLHRYEGHSARPVILIHGGTDSATSNTDWDHWLEQAHGERLIRYRLVDLSSVPGPFEFIAQRRIREGARPPGIPILLDWKGEMAELHSLASDRTTVLALDREGRIRARLDGPIDEDKRLRLGTLIDDLITGTEK